tara:strand:- start:1697 stop:1807 length:111 start_codon:yes stop_codon:yes gene_type:complete
MGKKKLCLLLKKFKSFKPKKRCRSFLKQLLKLELAG